MSRITVAGGRPAARDGGFCPSRRAGATKTASGAAFSLPPGDAERLFQPFTQGGADKSGVGLGLSISRRSVEANHGLLSVRDLPGKGCVFTVDLPRHVVAETFATV